jgi:hypothetical protein
VPLKTRKLDTKPTTTFDPLVARVKGKAELTLKRSRQPLEKPEEITEAKQEVEGKEVPPEPEVVEQPSVRY